ncbi:hypothetical protein [Winogradskyella marincola]|uniref:Uncharacterized protein n=1 Tax=Winogradskyella marincola TaxID=3037795 RepID=A0ABT6FXV1_9FLAO|nr:hypothetical protein [Winogradskyella sp. YYF002]MDG4714619.1 hypothetical protein [Winogradskyella sp. YYF002]
MDVTLLYKYHYEAVIKRSKHLVVVIFKSNKSIKRTFSSFYKDIIEEVKGRSIHYYDLYKGKYSNSMNVFDCNKMIYEGSTYEVIELVFENHIFSLYEKYSEKELLNFVVDLARRDALDYLSRHLYNHRDYYSLVYDTESYQNIYFDDSSNLYFRDSKPYNEMLDLKHPNRIKTEINLPMDVDVLKTSSSKNDKDSEIQSKLNGFDDDERMIIGYLLYHDYLKSKKRSISLNKFLLLVKIVGGYEDLSIFYQKTNSNTSYKKANEGPKYFAETSQKKLLNSLLVKLEGLGIDDISPLIRKELGKLK